MPSTGNLKSSLFQNLNLSDAISSPTVLFTVIFWIVLHEVRDNSIKKRILSNIIQFRELIEIQIRLKINKRKHKWMKT
jgi:hypothetical protein